MSSNKSSRVFWLGMHVVLNHTELPRLRSLGYEVFNPPYLADIYDQSADTQWNAQQPTTLPREVFDELSRHNFFYNRIPPRIAELLNAYFGTVIVTVSPIWLQSILAAYRGRVIYRTYGQPDVLTETMWRLRLFRAVQEREDFHFVPHADEAVRHEHSWLKSRMTVAPYTLPADVYDHENAWCADEPHSPEIMACCPNIENPYYQRQYRYLSEAFPEPHLRLYGVQRRPHTDPRVVGTLPRGEYLGRYRRASGYWFHYAHPTSCYLPPIEMMTVGGPVVYMRGSLLANSFENRGPGRADSVDDARRKLGLLLKGDRHFVGEVQDSQRPMVERYHPKHVWPIFDRVFRGLLDAPALPPGEPAVLSADAPEPASKRVYVLFHATGQHVAFEDGDYLPTDDLARTVKQVVQTLLAGTNHRVVVTCLADQLPGAHGYLDANAFPGRLRFLVLDPKSLATDRLREWKNAIEAVRSKLSRRRRTPSVANASIAPRGLQLRAWLARFWRAVQERPRDPWPTRCDCVARINIDHDNALVVVPHASCFPEALLLKRPLIVCAPDEPRVPGDRWNLMLARRLSSKAIATLAVSQIVESVPRRPSLSDTHLASPDFHAIARTEMCRS
jgi:hypothetical protein